MSQVHKIEETYVWGDWVKCKNCGEKIQGLTYNQMQVYLDEGELYLPYKCFMCGYLGVNRYKIALDKKT